jgi:hypothetical protein
VSDFLPSAFCRALGKEGFVESRTRQNSTLGNEPLYRVQDTRHRTTLGKGGARQRAVSGRPKADGRQSLPRAEDWHSTKNQDLGTSIDSLPSVMSLTLGKELRFTECRT